MGFGVSGSTAIIFLGVLVATGTLYTATSNATENVLEARDASAEQALERTNTAIDVTNATHYGGNDTLVVTATNTGSETLSVGETTLLVDNVYTSPNDTSVDGNAVTDLWYAGENLTMTIGMTDPPNRVKLVTATGVAATNTTKVVT